LPTQPDGPDDDPKKKKTLDELMAEEYSKEEAGKRLKPYLRKGADLPGALDFIKKVPIKYINENTTEGGKFEFLDENTKKPLKQPFIEINKGNTSETIAEDGAHEYTHALTYGLNGETPYVGKFNYTKMQGKVNSLLSKDKYDASDNYHQYLANEDEVRARLSELRMNRNQKSKGKSGWWDNWEEKDLENYKDANSLKGLRMIMDDENIIKALNELATGKIKKVPDAA
jgi:hypothetical protein